MRSLDDPLPAGRTAATHDGLGITVVSTTFDAAAAVLEYNRFNDPPADGNQFVLVRVRVQNLEGSVHHETFVDDASFRLAGSSGTLLSPFEHSCGSIPDGLSERLFKGGAGEGNICFEAPANESGMVLVYDPPTSSNPANRSFLEAAHPASIEHLRTVEASLEAAPDESLGHTRTNPMPAGQTAVAGDGLAVTVVSTTLDATSVVLRRNSLNDPPADGNQFVMVRVRAQSIEGSVVEERSVGESAFRLVGSSAVLFSPHEHNCGVIPDELTLRLFKGGAGEGNICFEAPADESGMVLVYLPPTSPDPSDRRWLQVSEPASIEPLRTVEVSLAPTPGEDPGHSRTSPLPSGQSITTSDGLSITVVSAVHDATSAVRRFNRANSPPAEGHRFVMARVRIENVDGPTGSEIRISDSDFRLVGSSHTLYFPFRHSCGRFPNEISLRLDKGESGEGNVCFQVPEDESDMILVYEPSSPADRRWLALPQA